jgi:hypothetical protein
MPLLAMVSIPTLAVKNATIAFSYDVLETVSTTEQPTTGTGAGAALIDLGARPAVLRGIVRRSSTAESRETTSIDVNVTIEKEPLPLGLERMLDLAELSMTEQPPAAPEEE